MSRTKHEIKDGLFAGMTLITDTRMPRGCIGFTDGDRIRIFRLEAGEETDRCCELPSIPLQEDR